MARSVQALIEPAVLLWARERSGLEQSAASKKAQVKPDQLSAWERGDGRPSIAQLRRLAVVYKRPLAAFYLPRPPKTFEPLRDYRRLPGEPHPDLSPELLYEIRRARERREIAVELYSAMEGQPPPSLRLRGSVGEDSERLAERIRTFLGVTSEEQWSWGSVAVAFKRWRQALESRHVLVFQAPRVGLAEMRGCSIAEMPMPAMVLNARDSQAGRVFTMLHELCHLVIRSGGLCDLGDDDIEVFCNRVAGAALVPSRRLLEEPAVIDHGGSGRWTDEDIADLARRYAVSREVILRRLLLLDRTTERFYREKRDEWNRSTSVRGRSGGGPPPHVLTVSRAGPLFVRLVLAGYHQEQITATDVADYLSVKLGHLPKIEAELAAPLGGVAA